MKKRFKYLPLLLLFAFFSYIVVANIMSWHVRTLQEIQTVSNDSLLYGKDWSPLIGDSVQITCRVVAPPQVTINSVYHSLLRGNNSWTCYAQDTANNGFGGIVIRQNTRFTNTFIQNADTGNIITVKGIVQEFWQSGFPWPDRNRSGWLTQISLDTSGPITFNSFATSNRPVPKLVNITDFAIGDYPNPGGLINYVGGEKYEGMYVEIRNVTSASPYAFNREPFSIVDAEGNKMYVRDFSNFFSTSPNDTLRVWTPPAAGTIINYIRGVIINANNEGIFGTQLPYVIVPIYPNDLSLGGTPPQLSGPSKTPGVPTPSDSVTVSVTIQPNTNLTASVLYRINGGAFTSKTMSLVAGNIFATKLPPASVNSLVEYFFKATNTSGLSRLLPADTAVSKLFYVVKASDSLSVQEVQYCPNNGGRSGYENAIVRGIEGIVTADTNDFYYYNCTPSSGCLGGTVSSPQRVIIQNGTGPFSGIWIAGTPADALQKGQKVRIRGTVTYSFGVNQIMTAVSSDVQILSSGNPLPAPQILTASVLANNKLGGDTSIKKWESVLVKINTPVWISCINANRGIACITHQTLQDTVFRRNFGEIFIVDNTNIESRVMLAGSRHTFTNNWDGVTAGKTLLTQNDSISFIQGILYYAYSNYKICPRTNSDFGTVTPVGIKKIEGVVKQFKLNQNYPNPFNPITRIGFTLPMYSKVTIKVYDVLGRQIQTLANENMNAGSFLLDFNGSELASGVYFIRMVADGRDGTRFADTKKMLLVK